jgi:hypothetical protein
MKISWREYGPYWLAQSQGRTLFSLCRRGASDVQDFVPPHTRWCVFADDRYDGYCGDVPIELNEADMKAMAITLWRLRDKA